MDEGLLKKSHRNSDRVAKDLISRPHVIARILQLAIPEFKRLEIKEIISLLVIEGERVVLENEETKDSKHKLTIKDLKLNINKDLKYIPAVNGYKISIEIQNTGIENFGGRARKTEYASDLIAEQKVDYEKLKEAYVIWIFPNPRKNYKDRLIYQDDQNGIFEVKDINGDSIFEYISVKDRHFSISLDSFIENKTTALTHTVEIYVSSQNVKELNNFQFIRELLINDHSDDNVKEIFREYGWNLRKVEEELMAEREDIWDWKYEDGKEAGEEIGRKAGKEERKEIDIKNLTKYLFDTSKGQLTEEEALNKAVMILNAD